MNDFQILLSAVIDQAKAQTKLNSQIAKLKTEAIKLGVQVDDKTAKQAILKLSKEQDSFYKKNLSAIDYETKKRQEQAKIYSNQIKAQMQERISAENKIQAELKQTAKDQQSALNLKSGKNQLNNNISTYLKENSKLSDDLKNKLLGIQSAIKSADKTKLGNLKNSFKEITTEAKMLGQSGQSVLGKFKQDLGAFTTFLSAGTLIMSFVHSVKEGVDFVGKLDAALTNINYTMDVSKSDLENIAKSSIQMAKDLKTSANNILEAVTIYANANETAESILSKAQPTIMLSNVTGMSSSETADILQGTMEQFDLTEESLMHISDVFETVSQSMNVDFSKGIKEIAEGIQASGSVADDAGISLENYTALLGNLIAKTRQTGSELGRSLRTMMVRTTQASLSAVAGGEVSEDDISKAETALRSVGVEVRDAVDSFRDFDDIMYDLYTKIDDISQVDLSAIAYQVAGTRQTSQFRMMIKSYGDYLDLAEKANDAEGTTLVNQTKYADSLKGSYSELTASTQMMWNKTINSDVIKFFVELSTKTVDLTNAVGGLVPIIGTLGASFILMKTGILPTLIDQIGMLMIAQTGYTASTVSAAYAQVGLSGAIKATGTAMKSFLLTNPVGWAILATTAIGGLAKLYDILNVSLEEQKEISSQLSTEYDEIQSKLSDINSELETTSTRIDELNGKDSLTIVEQQELDTLIEANNQLESQNRLLEEQARIKNEDLSKSVAKEFQKDMLNNTTEKTYWTGDTTQYAARGNVVTAKEYINTSEEDYAKNMIALMDEYNAKKERGITLTEEEQSQYDKMRKDLVDIGIKYNDYADRYKIDDDTSQSWRDFAKLIDKTLNPAEYETNLFDSIYNSESFAKAKSELESLALAGTLDESVIQRTTEYQKLMSATGLSASELVSHIKAITIETEKASDAADKLSSVLDTQKESIDAFQASMKTIQSALSSDLDSSALVDLMQEFSSFDWEAYGVTGAEGVGNIESALKELARQQYEALDPTLKTNEAFKRMYQDTLLASQGIVQLTDDISKKEQTDKEFYQAVIDNLDDSIKQQAYKYQIDFDNYKSLIEAKQALDEEYARQQQALVNAQMNFQNAMYSGDVEKIKQIGLEYAKVQKSFNDYFGLTTDFSASVTSTNDTYKKDPKVELPEKYVSDRADLEHRHAMGLSDEAYYTELKGLETDYLKGHKEYQSEIWSIDEAIYDHNQDLADKKKKDDEKALEDAKKANEEAIKSQFDTTNNIVSAYEKGISSINKLAGSYDDGSSQQMQAYSSGISKAADEIKFLNKEITKLNDMKNAGAFKDSMDLYDEHLQTLEDALYDAKTAITDFQESISKSIDSSLSDTLDNIEKSYEEQTKAIENQQKAYKDIIDSEKELIDLKEKQRDYEKDIAKQTKDISKLESRKVDLEKAASQGDREAINELNKVNEDLAKKKDDLTEDQHDHEVDLQKDALDKALDDSDKLYEQKLTNEENIHNKKVDDINALYQREMELISQASEYTKEQFTTALNSINTDLASLGVNIDPNTTQNILGAQSVIAKPTTGGTTNQATTSNPTTTDTSNDVAIRALLSSGTSPTGDSALNKYVKANYGSYLTFDEMAKLAKLLKMSGIDSAKDVSGNPSNRWKILEKLKKSGFASGDGTIALDNNMIKQAGENRIIFGRVGEGMFSPEKIKAIQELTKAMPLMKDLVKLSNPDLTKVITNNTSSPIINFNLTGGTITQEAMPQFNKWKREIVSDIVNEINKR